MIEEKIDRLIDAIDALTEVMSGKHNPKPVEAVDKPVKEKPKPVVKEVKKEEPKKEPEVDLSDLPFKNPKELGAYCMALYKKDNVKGAGIQEIIGQLGVSNITAVPTNKYHELKAKLDSEIGTL